MTSRVSISRRTLAVLYRLARSVAALRREVTPDTEEGQALRQRLAADVTRALEDLDALEPGWLERTPLLRSSNSEKGKR